MKNIEPTEIEKTQPAYPGVQIRSGLRAGICEDKSSVLCKVVVSPVTTGLNKLGEMSVAAWNSLPSWMTWPW